MEPAAARIVMNTADYRYRRYVRSNDQNLWMSLGEGGVNGRTFPRMI
jgi:hypothetical protein